MGVGVYRYVVGKYVPLLLCYLLLMFIFLGMPKHWIHRFIVDCGKVVVKLSKRANYSNSATKLLTYKGFFMGLSAR